MPPILDKHDSVLPAGWHGTLALAGRVWLDAKNIVALSAPCFSVADERGGVKRRVIGGFWTRHDSPRFRLAGYQSCPHSLPAIERASRAPNKTAVRKDMGETIGRVPA
jgi:hypothetical protein